MTKKLVFMSALAFSLLSLAPIAQAFTNMVVVNTSSHKVTVTCNAVGTIGNGEGVWSCIDANMASDDGHRWLVKDTHQSCGKSAWNIQYLDQNKNTVLTNACTHIPVGRTGCHYVEVTNAGLKVQVRNDEGLCVSQWGKQIGGPAVQKILGVLQNAAVLAAK